jgi:hypothetical protein
MRGILLVVTIVILSAGHARTDAFAQMLRPQFAPAEQLLVLKNGEVMRGQITRNAEQVILLTEQGSRVVLQVERTDFVCNSMVEAYWGKVARTKATDLAGQKQLFHWCLKNKMLEQAQNQIDILLHSKAKAADLEYMDRQLNVALIQQQNIDRRMAQASSPVPKEQLQPEKSPAPVDQSQPKSSMVLAPIKLNPSIGVAKIEAETSVEEIFRPLPDLNDVTNSEPDSQLVQLPPINDTPVPVEMDSSVRQVGFEEEIKFDTISLEHKILSASRAVDASETADPVDDRIMIPIHELDRETRSMPEGTLGHYRQRVERVLTNGCSAAKCHAADSRIMPLMQLSRSQPIPRRQSQRNLHNVLKYVDRAHPFESRLFLAATTPHAGLEKPILKQGSPYRESLMQWLLMLSDDPRQAVFEAAQLEQQTAIADEVATVQPIKPERDVTMPGSGSSLEFPDTIGEIPKLDAVDSSFTPIDPFDPEIFNRKYAK